MSERRRSQLAAHALAVLLLAAVGADAGSTRPPDSTRRFLDEIPKEAVSRGRGVAAAHCSAPAAVGMRLLAGPIQPRPPPISPPPPDLPSPLHCAQPQEYATNRVIVSFKPDVVVAMAAEEEGLQFMKPAGLQVQPNPAQPRPGRPSAAQASPAQPTAARGPNCREAFMLEV